MDLPIAIGEVIDNDVGVDKAVAFGKDARGDASLYRNAIKA